MILIVHFLDQKEPTVFQDVFDVEFVEKTDFLVANDSQIRPILILPSSSYTHVECLYEDEDDMENIH